MVSLTTSFQRLESANLLDALNDEVCAQLAQRIGEAVYFRWVQLAKGLPRSLSNEYVPGIQEVVMNGKSATVALLGDRPNKIEQGEPGIDLRKTLLGEKVPIVPPRQGLRGKHQSKKGGYYRAIPFRHSTPTKGKSRQFPSMGSSYRQAMGKEEALKFGKALYKAAKALAPSTTEPFRVTGKQSAALAVKQPGTRWGGRIKAKFENIGLLKPHHKTDIYAGMVRLEKTYQNATQSTYMTFRTISTAKTVGWHTQAKEGEKLMDVISGELPEMGKSILEAFAKGLKGKTDSV